VRVIEPQSTLVDLPGEALLPQVYRELFEIEDEVTRTYLARVAARVRDLGLDERVLALRGQPAPLLLDLERSENLLLITMATHGYSGFERFTLGSVAGHLIHHSRVPVLLVRPWGDETQYVSLARVLVPLDGSPDSEDALDRVEQLAGHVVTHVTIVRVVDPEMPAGETDAARQYLDAACERLTKRLEGAQCTVDSRLLYGVAAEQILDSAEHGYDLVVMATHGRSGLQRWALGSVADRLARHSRIPLLLIPQRHETARSQTTTHEASTGKVVDDV
jgi:nucleotide-binding universal stress UspA family protein